MINKIIAKGGTWHKILILSQYSTQGYFGENGQAVDGMEGPASFFEDGGKRWFRTGDIGEFDKYGKFSSVIRVL